MISRITLLTVVILFIGCQAKQIDASKTCTISNSDIGSFSWGCPLDCACVFEKKGVEWWVGCDCPGDLNDGVIVLSPANVFVPVDPNNRDSFLVGFDLKNFNLLQAAYILDSVYDGEILIPVSKLDAEISTEAKGLKIEEAIKELGLYELR